MNSYDHDKNLYSISPEIFDRLILEIKNKELLDICKNIKKTKENIIEEDIKYWKYIIYQILIKYENGISIDEVINKALNNSFDIPPEYIKNIIYDMISRNVIKRKDNLISLFFP